MEMEMGNVGVVCEEEANAEDSSGGVGPLVAQEGGIQG
jgi:hypothetical protein